MINKDKKFRYLNIKSIISRTNNKTKIKNQIISYNVKQILTFNKIKLQNKFNLKITHITMIIIIRSY